MRSKKALLNIITALALQIITIICGLIVPRAIITHFGSDTNGLLSSIKQFLKFIVLLEAGVGGVIRAALYKPLANNDLLGISKIVKAAESFFKRVAYIFLFYLAIISFLFPYITHNAFKSTYTISLVLIIGISSFFQYYFGISYELILQADQRKYIVSIIQALNLVVNTIMLLILLRLGAGIHIVKLVSSFVYVLKPILLSMYIRKKYKLIREVAPDKRSIEQRWNGLGHHIAYLIHESTDIVILTLFLGVKETSVYSVYFFVVTSIKAITITFSSGLEAAFGNMLAKNEEESLRANFECFEFLSFTITTILFTSTYKLIIPFVNLYTRGVTDANYYRPMFSCILVLAYAVYCIRAPYNSLVLAAGHYRETRRGAFIEAFINIFVSIVLVWSYGLSGVAIGTLCAMLYRTIEYALYLSKKIIKRSIFCFIKKVISFSMGSLLSIFILGLIPFYKINSYGSWVLYALFVTLTTSSIIFLMGIIFYREAIKNILSKLRSLGKLRKA